MGVKAEVEKSRRARQTDGDVQMDGGEGEDPYATGEGKGRNEWLEVAVDVPGLRDDDALPVFLGAMLSEALCADGILRDRLWINSRFHWRLYVDVSSRSAARHSRERKAARIFRVDVQFANRHRFYSSRHPCPIPSPYSV